MFQAVRGLSKRRLRYAPIYPYLDPVLAPEQRAEDLLSRMSLEDKAGQLFHSQIGMGPGGTLADADPAFGLPSTENLVLGRRMTHFNLLGVVEDGRLVAQWHNRLQELAASTPLGIPITISTDPRHHFTDNPGTAFNAGAVSQWPEPLGLAALRSVELVQRFADIARQEYLALGFRLALHPQVDLATEPRWSRIGATFGEDAGLTSCCRGGGTSSMTSWRSPTCVASRAPKLARHRCRR
jgi:beta-glucosidase